MSRLYLLDSFDSSCASNAVNNCAGELSTIDGNCSKSCMCHITSLGPHQVKERDESYTPYSRCSFQPFENSPEAMFESFKETVTVCFVDRYIVFFPGVTVSVIRVLVA